jgi:hypothetical protein
MAYEEVIVDGGMSGISLSHGGYTPPKSPMPDFGDGIAYEEEDGSMGQSTGPQTDPTADPSAPQTTDVATAAPAAVGNPPAPSMTKMLLIFLGVPVALGGIAAGISYNRSISEGVSSDTARNDALGIGGAVAVGSAVLSWLVRKL